MLTIYTIHPSGNLVHKQYKILHVGRTTRYKVHPNQLNRLKLRGGKEIRLKSQPIFSEASQTEWREPFDFQTGISGFPTYMVSTPAVSSNSVFRSVTAI